MKKVLYSLLAGLLLLGPMSCKKSDPAASLPTVPEAEVADDNKSGGIYKGAIIGSTGNIKIVLQGGKKEIVLTLDGVTRTLTTTALEGWTSGQVISGAEFISGDWSADLSISADGYTSSVTLNITGHIGSILCVLTKEKSFALVKVFEGTYAGTSSGTWNFVVQGNILHGASNETGVFEGSISGTGITISVNGSGTTASGTFSGNTATGTWSASVDSHGTWSGARKL